MCFFYYNLSFCFSHHLAVWQKFDTYPPSRQTSLTLSPAFPGQHLAQALWCWAWHHQLSTQHPLTQAISLLLCDLPSFCILSAFLGHQEALHSSGLWLGRGASAQGNGCSRLADLLIEHTHTTAHSCPWPQDARQCGQEFLVTQPCSQPVSTALCAY